MNYGGYGKSWQDPLCTHKSVTLAFTHDKLRVFADGFGYFKSATWLLDEDLKLAISLARHDPLVYASPVRMQATAVEVMPSFKGTPFDKAQHIAIPTVSIDCPDRGVPTFLEQDFWKRMADDLSKLDGAVAIGCMAGHGRTGLALAILWGLMSGSKTPMGDMRKSYCGKIIESQTQVEYVNHILGNKESVVGSDELSKMLSAPQKGGATGGSTGASTPAGKQDSALGSGPVKAGKDGTPYIEAPTYQDDIERFADLDELLLEKYTPCLHCCYVDCICKM